MENFKIFLIASLVGFIAAEVVTFRACPNTVGNCQIHQVQISPCPQAATEEPCRIKRGHSANIMFDYTTDFDAETLQGNVYWASTYDQPLVGMDTDACKFTKCPVVKEQRQTYNYTLEIGRKFPSGLYDIKWKLTGAENQECCFQTFIRLVK